MNNDLYICLNGRFVQEQQVLSPDNRAFRYGDGLFETMRLRQEICFGCILTLNAFLQECSPWGLIQAYSIRLKLAGKS